MAIRSELDFNSKETAIKIIGACIQIYNHFDIYMIPDKKGNPHCNVDFDTLMEDICKYYSNKRIENTGYGNDLDDQNKTKRFVISRINDSSYDVGVSWIATINCI